VHYTTASVPFCVSMAANNLDGHAIYYKSATIIPSAIAGAMMIGAVVSIQGFMASLECRPLRFLGRVSYSFYLLHWPMFFLCSLPVVSHPELFGTGFFADIGENRVVRVAGEIEAHAS
jgi:peptidoglycan/LPS O-acetylase OafA/YrhL